MSDAVILALIGVLVGLFWWPMLGLVIVLIAVAIILARAT